MAHKLIVKVSQRLIITKLKTQYTVGVVTMRTTQNDCKCHKIVRGPSKNKKEHVILGYLMLPECLIMFSSLWMPWLCEQIQVKKKMVASEDK